MSSLVELILKETEVGFRMAKEEPPSTSKDLQELQKKLSLLIASVQSNSKVVSFMKSPVGQYLDRHPFLTLTLLVFVAVSAVPVGFFPAPRGAYLPGCFCGSHITGRTGHLCRRPLTALCPVWLGLCVPHHIRDNHGVLHGSLQPHQLLVFS